MNRIIRKTYTIADLSIALMYYKSDNASRDINLDGTVDVLDYIIIASYIR